VADLTALDAMLDRSAIGGHAQARPLAVHGMRLRIDAAERIARAAAALAQAKAAYDDGVAAMRHALLRGWVPPRSVPDLMPTAGCAAADDAPPLAIVRNAPERERQIAKMLELIN
jgi:hypothetical protein